jgi:hypothetical protein
MNLQENIQRIREMMGLINEDIANQSNLRELMSNNIPLTDSIIDYLYGGEKVTTFHITDISHIDKMESIIGKEKPISTFTYIGKDFLSNLRGINTKGGVLFQIEGELVFDSTSDAMSQPDESGRRWLSINNFPPEFLNNYWPIKIEVDKQIRENDYNLNKTILTYYYRKIDELVKTFANKIKHWNRAKNSGKKNIGGDSQPWDEKIVQHIKIKDVLFNPIEPGSGIEGGVVGSETTLNDDEIKNITSKLENMSTGNVYVNSDPEYINNWLNERGGFTEEYDYRDTLDKTDFDDESWRN